MMRGVVLLALIVAYCIARPKSTTFVKPPTITTRINDVPRVNLWPQPNSVVFNPAQNITAIIPKYKSFQCTIQHAQTVAETNMLKDNFKRYQELFFLSKIDEVTDACTGNVVCLTELRVNVASTSTSDPVLEYSSDESYSITVDKQIIITSQTVWGAIRALETVSQLIQVAMTAKNQPVYALKGYTVPLQIDDAPRFHWRGLLVDTSRHYISVDKLLHILDSLSYIKMNVLHWHIVDSQSFPAVIPDFPLLSQKGAYAPNAIYTPQDITRVVDYAFMRGIRVVFEFDMPGHSEIWGAGYPNIIAKCPGDWPILSPAVEETFTVIDGLLKNMRAVARDAYFHIGGDEISTSCWLKDPTITNWMKQQGYTTVDQVLAYFERRVLDLVKKHDFAANVWEEVLTRYNQTVIALPKNTVVTAWTVPQVLPQILKAGYPGILSAGWYLDQQRPNGADFYAWSDTWRTFYSNEPYSIANFTESEKKLLLGGEACSWGESVDDFNFDERVFPRLLAVAERLWSLQTVNVIDGITYDRMDNQRCNMAKRGVGGGPVQPGYCAAVYGTKMSWQ